MKRRLVYILALLLIVTQGALALSTDTDGYYLIGSAQDLKDFAALVNGGSTTANGKLIAPINLAGSETNQWTPIGTGTYPYNGTFDGQGFTISNLYYKSQTEKVGLFGCAGSSARIKNIRVEGFIDTSKNTVSEAAGGTSTGGIIGWSEGATVINCSFSGSIFGFSNVGGIVGTGSVTVVNCYNEATVKFFSSNGQTGAGIHGYGGSPTLINCFNMGQIINTGSSTSHMGNIAISGTSTNCYSLANCCQNGAGAAWSNKAANGIPGTTMTSEEMQSTDFTNTLYSNALSLRATYPDIDTWMQDPTTNLPVLKQSYKPTEGPWTRAGEKTGYYSDSGDLSISWNDLNNAQWAGTVFPYIDNSNGLGTQMAGTASPNTNQAVYTLYNTTQTVPSYSVMVWNWSFQLKGHYLGLAQQTGLYAHTNLSTLKSTALDITHNNATDAGSEIRVGLVYHNAGQNGQNVSQNGSHNFLFDNRNGSTELAQPVYMIQTHISMNASNGNADFGPGWVSFKNVSSSYTYYYYKHVTFDANGGSGSMPVQTIENSGMLTENTFTRSGYTFAGWNTSPDGSGTGYANQSAITATESSKGLVTLYAQWDFQGSGTEDDPYLIPSETVWNFLAENVNAGKNYSGKYFRLTNDISVSTMVGNSESNSFRGTFDGDGHTLNINYSNTSDYTAPFRYIQGATFKNLKVTGSITTTMNFAAGIAGLNTCAAATFDQCVTDVAINSSSTTVTVWGTYDYHSGLLARTNSTNVNITDCVCGGSVDGSSATKSYCAGLVGVAVSCTVSATRCLNTTSYTNVYGLNSLCHSDGATRSASVFYYVNGTDGASPGTLITLSDLNNSSYATALQAGRTETVWVQDPITNQPMLKQFASNGKLPGTFSVSATKQVSFSQGNLQYQPSTGTWRFAANQYEAIGSGNSNVSASYDGWIDLFGWGSGNQPTQTSENPNVYSSFFDWGTNAILNGGNIANQWFTLSESEWTYLIFSRPNASSKRGRATVNGMYCFVLLPDDWTLPTGLSFTPDANNWTNEYTAEQWAQMEAAGAVCLPASGSRAGGDNNTIINDYNHWGCYWSSTSANNTQGYNLWITSNHVGTTDKGNYQMGASVRLVYGAPFLGAGTENDPYRISSEADWNLLADKVSIGYTYSGKFFRQTANIDVTTMVGNSDNTFSGTFDGDGYSVQITTNNKPLFGSVNGATIKNLVLTGSVEFSDSETGKGALIGTATGTTTVENCRVSTSVTYNKTTVRSGCIVGQNDGTLNISGCVFDGALTAPDGATEIGGIVYSPLSGDAKVRNCVFNPASVIGNITDFNCNFIRGNGTVHSNNYYFTTLSSTNAAWDGKQARSITAGTDVTISNLGDGIEYNISGITAYAHGIKFGDTFYAGNGDEVSLALSHADAAEGYDFGGYEASTGTLVGSDNSYTLTMASDDVTIRATWKKILTSANITIESVAYDGDSHTAVVKCGETNLVKGTDYTVTGTDALTAVGSTTFTITGIGGYTGTVEKTFTIYSNFAFTNSDWMTWYGAEDLTVNTNEMETYVVTDVSETAISIESTEGKIYLNKPMLLKRVGSNPVNVHGYAPAEALTAPTGLSKKYIGGKETFDGYTDGTVYVLAGSEFIRARVTESTTFSPSKCFIYITAKAGSRLHIVADGDATGMRAIDDTTEETWYTINGFKLSKRPTRAGMYICNGKKVVVK